MRIPMLLAVALVASAYAQVPDPTETVAITSAAPASASGLLYISKADTNAPGLRNPVLVVEGFDLDNSMDWPELYDLLNRENLVVDLKSFGRDLLILNFGDSTLDILENAALNEAAIAYVNANRADPSDKFTVVGASLGGLTLRKALVDMPNHGVDTWISFDAPHEGANIPLGIQEFLEFFAPYNPAAEDLLAAVDSPASRQLLLVHHDHADGLAGGDSARESFATIMESTGYPTNCKSIAISNGSGFGDKLPFDPGELIIRWTDDSLFYASSADVHTLPQSLARVFHGSVRILFSTTTKNVDSYHPLPLDNAPGGMRSTFFQLYTNLTTETDTDNYCNYSNHCFIPTVSALGIPIENLASNLNATAGLLALSPFDEIHYAPANEEHVELNLNNKRWIMRAVLEGIDTDSDGWDDYQEYLMGTAYDSADSGLKIELAVAVLPTNDAVRVAWPAFPNTQYHVWHAEALDLPWQPIDTILPTTQSGITNQYDFPASATTNGFFIVTGEAVDPVSD